MEDIPGIWCCLNDNSVGNCEILLQIQHLDLSAIILDSGATYLSCCFILKSRLWESVFTVLEKPRYTHIEVEEKSQVSQELRLPLFPTTDIEAPRWDNPNPEYRHFLLQCKREPFFNYLPSFQYAIKTIHELSPMHFRQTRLLISHNLIFRHHNRKLTSTTRHANYRPP